ncbi:MAG: hypothetical protein U0165_18060 [Polyangiaceae bacterium]
MTDPVDLAERAARADELETEVLDLRARLALIESEHHQLVQVTSHTDEERVLLQLTRDVPLAIARGLLGFLSVWSALAGVMSIASGVAGGLYDPRLVEHPYGMTLALTLGVAVSLVFFAYAAAAFFGRRGLAQGKHDGWVTSLIVFCMSLLFGCLPVGIYGLYALLRGHVRRAYFPVK